MRCGPVPGDLHTTRISCAIQARACRKNGARLAHRLHESPHFNLCSSPPRPLSILSRHVSLYIKHALNSNVPFTSPGASFARLAHLVDKWPAPTQSHCALLLAVHTVLTTAINRQAVNKGAVHTLVPGNANRTLTNHAITAINCHIVRGHMHAIYIECARRAACSNMLHLTCGPYFSPARTKPRTTGHLGDQQPMLIAVKCARAVPDPRYLIHST